MSAFLLALDCAPLESGLVRSHVARHRKGKSRCEQVPRLLRRGYRVPVTGVSRLRKTTMSSPSA